MAFFLSKLSLLLLLFDRISQRTENPVSPFFRLFLLFRRFPVRARLKNLQAGLLVLIIQAYFQADVKKDGELLDFSMLLVYIDKLSLVPQPVESGFKALYIWLFQQKTMKTGQV